MTAGADDVEVLEDLEEISAESLEKQGAEAPVIKLVNVVLMSAIQKGASDIHIEPYEKEFRVRYRVDGILYNIMSPPMKMRDAITSRRANRLSRYIRSLQIARAKRLISFARPPCGRGRRCRR